MAKIEFNMTRFPARKDLLHFVEESEGDGIYAKIGENPRAWLEELNIIQMMLSKYPLAGGSGMDVVPIDESDVRRLGNNALLYRGDHRRSRGLWIKKDTEPIDDERFNWDHYRLGTSNSVFVNEKFNDVKPELLLPENFEPISRGPEGGKAHGKRPIRVFDIEDMTVYAKAPQTIRGFYHPGMGPGYRLTSISDIVRPTSARKERDMTEDLMNFGVRVPEIIGFIDSDTEPCLFLRGVEGKSPDNYITTHRTSIIDQDARMLAAMCLGGYRKQGFADFDDKVFDGRLLHLIDVDECRDLYWVNAVDYRKVLLNPSGGAALDKFRDTQRHMFELSMKDAIFMYKGNLTPNRGDQERYVRSFYKKLGWESPDTSKMDELLDFSGNYSTLDQHLSMMADTD